jgi:hypothetical protein
MRRSRRMGASGPEFGGSGEDSFVAVVVTKLTGALLFILLLAMVIMALLPKAVDLAPRPGSEPEDAGPPLAIATPGTLPEAIAGRPYVIAMAATGGRGSLRWSVDGELPEGMAFDASSGLLQGTPKKGAPAPIPLVLRVSDGQDRATRATELVVYQPDAPLTLPSRWKPALPPIPWRAWLEHGVGFLALLLVHMVAMNALAGLERWSIRNHVIESGAEADVRGLRGRFTLYRAFLRLASLSAASALAIWLLQQRY